METKIMDDLIVLGRAGPELISDGRHTVCLAGWSESDGFIRLYPTNIYCEDASRWNIIRVPVVDDDSDPRDESWKIEGSKKEWRNLPSKIEKVGELEREKRPEFMEELPKICPNELNEKNESLGLVKPEQIHDAYLEEREKIEPIPTDLTGKKLTTKKSFNKKLKINYTCDGCETKQGYHDQQVVEWGIFEYWRKNPSDKEKVIENLRLFDEKWRKYFLVGNMRHRLSSYIIIDVLRFKMEEFLQKSLDKY